MNIEEERQPRSKVINGQAGIQSCLDISDGIAQGKSHLLNCRRPCLSNVVAANRYGIPLGQLTTTKGNKVRHQSHGGLGWENISAPSDVFLQNVILDCAGKLFQRHSLLLGDCNCHGQENSGSSVDGHGNGHKVKRDPRQ